MNRTRQDAVLLGHRMLQKDPATAREIDELIESQTRLRPVNLPTRYKHQTVEKKIRDLVKMLPVGARLPSERSLAASFGCNFLTVRRALKELVNDGSVVRRIGSGTFVTRHVTARSIPSQATRIEVLVCYDGNDAHTYHVMRALVQNAPDHNVELHSSWVRNFCDDGLAKARLLQKEGVTAITIPWFDHTRSKEIQRFVRDCPMAVSLPVPVAGLEKNCFERPEVFARGLRIMTEALCGYSRALGRERIAFIGPDAAEDVVLQKMLSAYTCYSSRENLANFCGLVRAGTQAMDQLAERWRAFRGDLAVIAYDAEHALRFITAMHKLGLSAPADFQIVSCDDTEAGRFSDPPLSTIRQNFEYVAQGLIRSALGLAHGQVNQSDSPPRPKMIMRGTCGGRLSLDEDLKSKVPQMDIATESDEVVATSDF